MKFTIDKKEVMPIIQNIGGIAKGGNAMSSTAGILIEAKDKQINFTASDLDITVRTNIENNIIDEGIVLVNARYLLGIINSLNSGNIDFYTDGEILKIESGSSKFSVNLMYNEMFPLFNSEDFVKNKSIKADPDIFRRILKTSSVAVLQEANRPIFTGVRILVTKESLTTASTDGKRISETVIDAENDVEENIEAIIPIKTVLFLRNTMQDDEINIYINKSNAVFFYGKYQVFSQVIAGQFPDYSKVFSFQEGGTLTIDKQKLILAVKRISLMSSEEYYRIKFDINKEKITASSNNNEVGSSLEEIDGFEYNGEPFTIAYNHKFLTEILNVIETDNVSILFGRPVNGAINTQSIISNSPNLSDIKVNILLMPLRLK